MLRTDTEHHDCSQSKDLSHSRKNDHHPLLDEDSKHDNDFTFSVFSENFKNKKRNIVFDTLIFDSNLGSKKINYETSENYNSNFNNTHFLLNHPP